MRIFSSIDRSGKTASSDIYVIPSRIRALERIRVTSVPPRRMLPCRASIRPTSDLRKVVLSAPLVPSSSTVSPARTSRSTPHNTCIVPYPASTPWAVSKGAASGGMLASEKHLDHLRNLDRNRELTLENLLAGVHDDDAIGDVLDEAHQMLDHDDRHAPLGQGLDALGDPVEFRRVEAGGEFVEQQEPRTGGERAHEIEHLLLRVIEIGRRAVGDLGQPVFAQ